MDIYSHRDESRDCRPIYPPAAPFVGTPFIPLPTGYVAFNSAAWIVHNDNVTAGWWTDLATGARLQRNVGEMLMLVVSELAEGDEGAERGLMDDKIPTRPMLEVELADAKIRLLDIAGGFGLDIAGAAHDLLTLELIADPCPFTPFDTERNVRDAISASLMRIAREVARAMEGHRKRAPDPILTIRSGFECGVAAALLRLQWLSEALCYDLDSAVHEKRAFNRVREDHKVEARRAAGGKAY